MIGRGKQLNDAGRWLLFRAMVCDALVKRGIPSNAWDFSEALDWSFDEMRTTPYEDWPKIIDEQADAYAAFVKDSAGEFGEDV